MGDFSAHFDASELACRGCGRLPADLTNLRLLVSQLEVLRMLAGTPIVIHDAYRCPEHNAAVCGEPDSQHLLGKAADIHLESDAHGGRLPLQAQYDYAKEVHGFGAIGVYDTNFLHVDTRERKPDGSRHGWARVNGNYTGLEALVTP